MRFRAPTGLSSVSGSSVASTASERLARKAREREARRRQREREAKLREKQTEARQGRSTRDEYPATRQERVKHGEAYAHGGRKPPCTPSSSRREPDAPSSPIKRGLQFIYEGVKAGFGYGLNEGVAGSTATPPATPSRRWPGAFPGMSIDSDSEAPSSPSPSPAGAADHVEDADMPDMTEDTWSSPSSSGPNTDSSSFSSSNNNAKRSSFFASASASSSTEDFFASHECKKSSCSGGYFYTDPANGFRLYHDCQKAQEAEEAEHEAEAEGTRSQGSKEEREDPERGKREAEARAEAEERERLRKQEELIEQLHAEAVKTCGRAPTSFQEFCWKQAMRNHLNGVFASPPSPKPQPMFGSTFKKSWTAKQRERQAAERQRAREQKAREQTGSKKRDADADEPRKTREEAGHKKEPEESYTSRWFREYVERLQREIEEGKTRAQRKASEEDKKSESSFTSRTRDRTSRARSTHSGHRSHPYARSATSSRARSGAHFNPSNPGPSSASKAKENKDPFVVHYESYEAKWKGISSLRDHTPLTFSHIPWPLVKFPRSPADITADGVKEFMRTCHAKGVSSSARSLTLSKGVMTRKQKAVAAKAELRNWHPDKFSTRVLSRILDEGEKEMVRAAADVVQKALTSFMTEDDSQVKI